GLARRRSGTAARPWRKARAGPGRRSRAAARPGSRARRTCARTAGGRTLRRATSRVARERSARRRRPSSARTIPAASTSDKTLFRPYDPTRARRGRRRTRWTSGAVFGGERFRSRDRRTRTAHGSAAGGSARPRAELLQESARDGDLVCRRIRARERGVRRGEGRSSVRRAALLAAVPRERDRGAELEEPGVLRPRDVERAPEAPLGLGGHRLRRLAGGTSDREQVTLRDEQAGLVQPLAGALHLAERRIEPPGGGSSIAFDRVGSRQHAEVGRPHETRARRIDRRHPVPQDRNAGGRL